MDEKGIEKGGENQRDRGREEERKSMNWGWGKGKKKIYERKRDLARERIHGYLEETRTRQ